MSTISVNTAYIEERERGLGEYEPDTYHTIPVVEVWIGGLRFAQRCSSAAQARDVAMRTARELGLDDYGVR
jgi:hypothetical protein